ncbi:YcbK family protein [Rhizobium sp. Rhizsp82]|uniref:YcbK family protein n=1 Tax=Rhizobium sp. Rhizsp82 TaxID=3243057 RepID=UPI0039B52657
MHTILSLALAGLFAVSCCLSANAQTAKKPSVRLLKNSANSAYTVQTVSVRVGCFPPRLRGILAHIAAKTGRRPMVTSGFRPHSGRSHSQHRHCNAADIRVPGVSERVVIAAAQSAPGIGGIGRYCNGIVHVDTGPKRRWTYC